jgi:hypothetical protein
MKKIGYAESTIETTSQRLRQLAKYCNLKDPESVRSYRARARSMVEFEH